VEIWPAILVSGVSFRDPAVPRLELIGPELVDVIAAISSMVCLIGFLRVWKPKTIWTSTSLKEHKAQEARAEPGWHPASCWPARAAQRGRAPGVEGESRIGRVGRDR
jgi:lactate permease